MLKCEAKSKDIYNLLVEFDTVLGLDIELAQNDIKIVELLEAEAQVIPGDVTILAEKRWIAKKEKRYKDSDELREQIFDLGYQIKDAADSYTITKI